MALRKINVAVCMFSRHCQLAINLSTSNWTSTQLSQLEQTARHASSSLSWEPFRRHADATATSRKVVVAGLLGLPNAGKSQLANALCGKRVTAVSAYEHTTDKLKVAAYTLGRSQVSNCSPRNSNTLGMPARTVGKCMQSLTAALQLGKPALHGARVWTSGSI